MAGPVAAPLAASRGVGPALAAKLARLGVREQADLLFVLPLRYEDRTHIVPLGALQAGSHAVVEGEVLLAEVVFRRRRQLLVRLGDGSGSLTLRFFHFSNVQRAGLSRGTRLRCHGEVRRGPLGLEIVHPEYRQLAQAGSDAEPLPQTLTPIYPLTEGVTQGRLRGLIQRAFAATEQAPLIDLLPDELRAALHLSGLRDALEFLHQPPLGTQLDTLRAGRHPAQRRLALEELLAHQLSLAALRRATKTEHAVILADAQQLEQRLLAALPFRMTAAQQRVRAEINVDLQLAQPMTRLIQGDVGCGKTAVAAAAAAHIRTAGRTARPHADALVRTAGHSSRTGHWLATRACAAYGAGRHRRGTAAPGGGHPCAVPGEHAISVAGAGDHR
jgi:ATP-dependent DNA helicase RecG